MIDRLITFMTTKKTAPKKKKTLSLISVREILDTNYCDICEGTGRDKPESTCAKCEGTGKLK